MYKSKPTFLSFENKWGVICYFEFTHYPEFQRTIFIPFENPADSSSIQDNSGIFQYKYGIGMDYHDSRQSNTNYKIYWLSDHKKILFEKDYPDLKIFWVFAKLKYHAVKNVDKALTSQVYHFTLVNNGNQLSIETIECNDVAIDTVYFKKRYVPPYIDIKKLRLRKREAKPGMHPR